MREKERKAEGVVRKVKREEGLELSEGEWIYPKRWDRKCERKRKRERKYTEKVWRSEYSNIFVFTFIIYPLASIIGFIQ